MGADVGNPRHLQQTLHGPVLAVFAVEHREHHVNGGGCHGIAGKAQQALPPDGRNNCRTAVRVCDPGFGGQHGVIRAAKVKPLSISGDAHGQNMVFFLVNMVQNGFRRAQRNLVLRADAAEQNANR